MLNTVVKTADVFVYIASISFVIFLSVAGIGRTVMPLTVVAYSLNLGKIVLHEIVLSRHIEREEQFGKGQNN